MNARRGERGHGRAAITALRVLCVAALAMCISAAENGQRVTFACADAAASDVLGTLVELSRASQHADTDLVAGSAAPTVSLFLADASPATQRQAFAHALGCWWAPGPEAADIVYTRDPHLPTGVQRVAWVTSGLVDQPGLEPLVTTLMTPWLSGHAGISYQPNVGGWPATLDAAGQAQLLELLTVFERPTPRCPLLLPDPDAPDLDKRIEAPIRSATWGGVARLISRAAGISVALSADLPARTSADRVDLASGSLASLVASIARTGMRARIIHGVLCIGVGEASDREHAGSVRRLAVIPIPQLVRTEVDGDLIVAALVRRVSPDVWGRSGFVLAYRAQATSLLVAADPATIHAVLDAVDRLDRLGVEDGLASLAAAK